MQEASLTEYAKSAPGDPIALISLSALRRNYRLAARLVRPAELIAVVKANGYGHGAVETAKALAREGARSFAVARLSEALALRAALPRAEILILGHSPPAAAPLLARLGLVQAVGSLPYALRLAEAAEAPVRIHLKIDGGMGRLGLCPDEAGLSDASRILSHPLLCTEAIFSHLPTADDPSEKESERRLARIAAFGASLSPHLPIHALASAGILRFGAAGMPLVRSGILLYGYSPSSSLSAEGFSPAMHLYAPILAVRHLRAGDTVGYGSRFIAPCDVTAATLAIGYGDGLPRSLSGASLSVSGAAAPILGRICMDMTVCRLPDGSGLQEGDLFPIFGGRGASLSDLARAAKTIPYELLSALTARVRRIYDDEGKG